MFIQDIRRDFYNVLLGKRVLIIVNYDIDGICSTKIITNLLRSDNVMYSMVQVLGITGMKRAFNDYKTNHKYVLLVNCGGCIDIVEFLEPEEDVVFFICDSHRPIDVCNVYSDRQVRILAEQTPDEGIPQFDEIFQDSEDEEDESDGEATGGVDDDDNDETEAPTNRIEKMERAVLKRRERRKWIEQRDKLMFDYTQYSYYGRSSAVTLFELAWMMSKDSVELLWWAIVGITEQLVLGKIENSSYLLESGKIQSHVSRLQGRTTNQTGNTSLKITYENDLHLALYRHWAVIESLKYSLIPACTFRMWTHRGEKRMHELLVEMGLPLVQARQTYASMELVLRKEFLEMMEKLAPKYKLNNFVFGSFTLSHGYRYKFAASDYVYSMLAILETIKSNRTPEHCFLEAMDTLTHTNVGLLETGIGWAKQLLLSIFKQTQLSLELKQIISAGPFVYFVMQEDNPYFSFPYGLWMLAKFMVRAYVAESRSRRAAECPLIACCPIDMERGVCLLVGVPPVAEDMSRSFFGKAFEQAAIKSKASVLHDCVEPSIIQIKQTDLTNFMDALVVLLS